MSMIDHVSDDPSEGIDRDERRRALRDAFETASDETLAVLVRQVQSDIRIGPDGRVQPMRQWSWDWREALLSVAWDRFSLDDDDGNPRRMPDTVDELLTDELASATWAVMHTGWASHDIEVPRWLKARAESLSARLSETHAAAAELATRLGRPVSLAQVMRDPDPMADVVTEEGGYRWFGDGRTPRPIAT